MKRTKFVFLLLVFLITLSSTIRADDSELVGCPQVSTRSDCFVNDEVNGQILLRMYKYNTANGKLSPLLAPNQVNSEALALSEINFNDLIKKETTSTFFLPVLPSGAKKGIRVETYVHLEDLQKKVDAASGENKTKAQQDLDTAIEEAKKEVSASVIPSVQIQ